MKIRFRSDVVTHQNMWTFLDRIIHRIEDGWHEWEIEDPQPIEESPWLQGRPHIAELLRMATRAGSFSTRWGLHRKRVIVSLQPQEGQFDPPTAASYLGQPLTLLLENRHSDGQFLHAVLALLGPSGLLDLLKSDGEPLRYDSQGGTGELIKLLQDYLEKANSKGVPPRVMVVMDSDSRFPGDLSREAKQIAAFCETRSVPCHVLRKRSIENYLPDELLEMRSQDGRYRARIAALQRLCPLQRDHLPLKKKGPRLRSGLSSEEQHLYASIGNTVWSELGKLNVDVDFLLEKHRNVLTAEGLRRRDGKGELDELVDRIIDEL